MSLPAKTSAVAAEPANKRSRRTGPRTPRRAAGVARYAALLDATDALLEEQAPDVIGLYQIAERAGIPPASIYHFFPTKEAAYEALAERYCDEVVRIHSVPIRARELRTWEDLHRIDVLRAADYFNQRTAARKILYGGYGGVEARNIDKVFVRKLAMGNYERLNRIFHMPFMAEADKRFEVRIAILDAIWEISVRLHGVITREYTEEALRACNAYMRLYLPEYLEPRPELLDAIAKDGELHLYRSDILRNDPTGDASADQT